MADERDQTAEAQAEAAGMQQWIVQAYQTIYTVCLANLRGFGLPADEAPRAFVTGAVQFVEDISRRPDVPVHVIARVFDDAETSLTDGLDAVRLIRTRWAEAQAEQAAETASPTAEASGPRAVPDPPDVPGKPPTDPTTH